MKALVFDSSSIITLALNGLTYLLEELKKNFDGKFFISHIVKREIVEKPIEIKRFELEALTIAKLIENKTIEVMNIPQNKIDVVLENANSIFMTEGEYIKILHQGESSCIALAKILQEQGYEVTLVIDERTTRMLLEAQENLSMLLERKLHKKVIVKKKYRNGFDVIRSAEICFVAYEKGIIKLDSREKALDALLYATKYKGCAISSEEIEKAKKLS